MFDVPIFVDSVLHKSYISITLSKSVIRRCQLGLRANGVRERILKAEGTPTGSIIKHLQAKHLLVKQGNEYKLRVLPPELKGKAGMGKNGPLHGGALRV
jgi:hypothetical protein